MQRIRKTIAEFLNDAPVPVVRARDKVDWAVATMRILDASCVLVEDEGALVGIFTGRDYLNRVVAERRIPTDVIVGEVMTPDPKTLAPEHCISYAISLMAESGLRNVPITAHGRARSILGVGDVLAHLSEVLAEIEAPPEVELNMSEWIDIGGGG